MKLETFFEKFDQLAEAPHAVETLRELVLRLATSGRIAEQDASEVPGHECLKAIFAARDSQVRRGLARLRTEGSAIAAGDTMDIPASWARCMLAEVCDLQTGATPSRQESRYFAGDIRWLVSGDVNQGEITECEGRITELGLKNSNCKIIPANAVLIALNGQGKTRGTVAILRVPAALNQSLVAMISFSPEHLLPEFVYWNLRGRYYAIRDITGQDQRRGLNMRLIGQLSLPVPPVAEQKRIVARVDELMALCDRLEAQQKGRQTRHAVLTRAALARLADAPSPANLDLLFHDAYTIEPADLRKTVLTLAIQGKLVPQDTSDETGEILLETIGQRRTALLQGGYPNRDESITQSRKQETQALPAGLEPLAPGWAWATLMQASLVIVDCHNKTAPYVDSGIRLLRTTNIRNGRLNLAEPKFVDEATYERWSARVKPEPGDILITREAPMGEVCIIPDDMKVCLGQRMMLIRIAPGTMDRRYLLYSLMAPDLMERVQDKPVGATVQHLRVGGVETLLTPIPPLAEQRRIVATVDRLMAFLDELAMQLTASRSAAGNLLEAVVVELTTRG